MQPKTFIFIGNSGCGKGTQAKLVSDYLKSNDSKNTIFYMESGEKFREFLKETGYTQGLARELAERGDLQPSFLAVHIWSHLMIENMNENVHLLIDGAPRTLSEAMTIDSAMEFYKRTEPTVIYLKVSNEWSKARLASRGRFDDKGMESVERRLAWFDRDVIPAIEHLKSNPKYKFIEVNGEQSIEQVFAEIKSKIF